MPISLRLPPEKEAMIKEAIEKTGKTKTSFILEAIDEKLGVVKNREQRIRALAGWLTHEEADELRENLEVFAQINDKDWE